MQQSAKAKTTGILIFVSHTPFLNIFPAYHFFKKNLCSLKVVQTVITKAMNLFIWKSSSWNMGAKPVAMSASHIWNSWSTGLG